MADMITLNAEARELHGKAASRRMRRLEDRIPAVVYGAGKDAVSLSMSHKDVSMALENEAVYSSVLNLNVGGKKEQVVLKALQRHPVKARILHVDFLRINTKEKLTMSVPLHYINEDVAVGLKAGGVASHLMTELEIKCLPADLPEFIEVDTAAVELDHSLHLSDVVLPKGVELTVEIDGEHNAAIYSIHKAKAAAEEPTEAPEAPSNEADSAAADDKSDAE